MNAQLITDFAAAVAADATADTSASKTKEMDALKVWLTALCAQFATDTGLTLTQVIDGLAIAAGEMSSKLNMARAKAAMDVAAKYQTEVDAAAAAMMSALIAPPTTP